MFVDPPSTLYERIYRLFLPGHLADRMDVVLLKYSMDRDLSDDGLRFYKDYIAEIQRIVPKEKLLVMNVKEGWEPLCAILGEKVPGRKSPRVNDKQSFVRNNVETGRILNRVVMAIVVGLVVACRRSAFM